MAVIRVSGYPGAGKTTLAQKLSSVLGYEYFYTGAIFRKMAAEKHLSIENFYSQLLADPKLEKSIDREQLALMTKDNRIVEGRMAPFQSTPFQAINVLLLVQPEEGAKRERLRKENQGKAISLIMQESQKRVAQEKNRYQSLYGIEDHLDPAHFDIVIHTTLLSPEKVFSLVFHEVKLLLGDG